MLSRIFFLAVLLGFAGGSYALYKQGYYPKLISAVEFAIDANAKSHSLSRIDKSQNNYLALVERHHASDRSMGKDFIRNRRLKKKVYVAQAKPLVKKSKILKSKKSKRKSKNQIAKS